MSGPEASVHAWFELLCYFCRRGDIEALLEEAPPPAKRERSFKKAGGWGANGKGVRAGVGTRGSVNSTGGRDGDVVAQVGGGAGDGDGGEKGGGGGGGGGLVRAHPCPHPHKQDQILPPRHR